MQDMAILGLPKVNGIAIGGQDIKIVARSHDPYLLGRPGTRIAPFNSGSANQLMPGCQDIVRHLNGQQSAAPQKPS